MKKASTLQFREAVRQALKQENTEVYQSWTDAPVTVKGKRYSGNKRYVCIWPRGLGGATEHIAQAVEQILGKQGLTAETRCSSWYVRGTCILK
jgi:hypothetical protein